MIGPDGTIYVSAYDGVKFGYLYAIRPDGSLNADWGTNPQTHPVLFNAPPSSPRTVRWSSPRADTQRVYALRTSDGLPDTNWGLNGVPIGGDPQKHARQSAREPRPRGPFTSARAIEGSTPSAGRTAARC